MEYRQDFILGLKYKKQYNEDFILGLKINDIETFKLVLNIIRYTKKYYDHFIEDLKKYVEQVSKYKELIILEEILKNTPALLNPTINLYDDETYKKHLSEVIYNDYSILETIIKEKLNCKFLQFEFIEELDLSHNKIEVIEGIDNHTKLQELDLSHNKIEAIKGFDELKQLQKLDLKIMNEIQKEKVLNKLLKKSQKYKK